MRFLLLVVCAGACTSASSVTCDDGSLCPEGAVCAVVDTKPACVLQEQLDACAGDPPSERCTMASGAAGTCHDGVCLPAVCGNSFLDFGEVCDDGNTQPNDGCSSDCLSTEVCGNHYTDAQQGEDCDDGNTIGHDGCSPTCVVEQPVWSNANGDRPQGRSNAALAYDTKRNRAVMFGGNRALGIEDQDLGDTYEYDGARWFHPTPPIAPSPREGHQMAFDEARGETLLFSGRGTPADTWTWNGLAWTARATATVPPDRFEGAMVYDPRHERIVMFGGRASSGLTFPAGTWIWDGADWHLLATTGAEPSARSGHVMAYDKMRGVIVMFGGTSPPAVKNADLWELDGDTWSMKTQTTPPGFRSNAAAAWDPIRGRVVVIGGIDTTNTIHRDGWAWNGTNWTAVQPVPMAVQPIYNLPMLTDPRRGRVLLQTLENLYELTSTGWDVKIPLQDNDPDNPPILSRSAFAMVADTMRHRLVVIEGRGPFSTFDDTWAWNGGWTQLANGPVPARFGSSAAFDRERGLSIVFGGCNGPSGSTGLAETWSLADTWQKLTGAAPPARCFGSMTYDVARHQIVLFGGSTNEIGAKLADTWTWDGAWTPHTPATTPTAVSGAAIGYDEDRGEVVMFSGESGGIPLPETYVWDGTNWTMRPVPTSPPPRAFGMLAWNPVRHRLTLYGGDTGNGAGANDAWEWDGAAWSLVPTIGAPGERQFGMTTSLEGDGVIVFGSSTQVSRLRWEAKPGTAYETCSGIDFDGDTKVGCADDDCAAVCDGCGDGMCDPNVETCSSCDADCGACAP